METLPTSHEGNQLGVECVIFHSNTSNVNVNTLATNTWSCRTFPCLIKPNHLIFSVTTLQNSSHVQCAFLGYILVTIAMSCSKLMFLNRGTTAPQGALRSPWRALRISLKYLPHGICAHGICDVLLEK